MQEHMKFLKVSGMVMKIISWVILALSILAAVFIFMGKIPGGSRLSGLIVLLQGSFSFFFIYLIGRIASAVALLIKESSKSVSN
ncbi:hypothetical protein D4R78_02970 [bacterium]|nr:MAG: hypothetical protein D4R78_02970 [bacterium]